MGEFFKGWRWKAGCVTLVMACVFAAGWIRSFHTRDELRFRNTNTIEHLGSLSGSITWMTEYQRLRASGAPFFDWMSENVGDRDFGSLDDVFEEWKWKFLGCGMAESAGDGLLPPLAVVTVSYWSIVLPLILLSAYLLFSKTRVAKPNIVGENPKPD